MAGHNRAGRRSVARRYAIDDGGRLLGDEDADARAARSGGASVGRIQTGCAGMRLGHRHVAGARCLAGTRCDVSVETGESLVPPRRSRCSAAENRAHGRYRHGSCSRTTTLRSSTCTLVALAWPGHALSAALDRPTPVAVDLSALGRRPLAGVPPPLIDSFSAWVSRGRSAWITVASTIGPPIANQPLARSSASSRANSRSAAPARANCSRYSQIVLAPGRDRAGQTDKPLNDTGPGLVLGRSSDAESVCDTALNDQTASSGGRPPLARSERDSAASRSSRNPSKLIA